MTKTSGSVKRWRESFRAVSAQRRSAVNGSQTTSEEWSWCSAVAPSCPPCSTNVALNGLALVGEPQHRHTHTHRAWPRLLGCGAASLGGHNSKSALRCTLLSVIGEEAAFHSLLLIAVGVVALYEGSFFKAALTIPFLSVMSEKLLPLIIPGSGSKQAAPFPFSITCWIFSTHIKKEKKKEASWAYHVLNAALCCCIKITPRIWLQPTKARNIKLKLQCSFLSALLWGGIVALLKHWDI